MRILPPYRTGLVPDSNQVYPPREDTFLLLSLAQAEITPLDRILEVGTGSGYIVSNLQRCSFIVATDINPHAVRITKTRGVMVIRTDLMAGLQRSFTLVLFNPPYIPTSQEERCDDWLEFALDGGPDGRGPLIRFLNQVKEVLLPSGRILLLISSLQEFNTCEELFTKTGFLYTIVGNMTLDDGENLRVYRLIRKKEYY